MKKKIIFICKYNCFRSRIAEAYFNKINKNKNIEVSSRGFIQDAKQSDFFIRIGKFFGLNIRGTSNPLKYKELINSDFIVVVANDIPRRMFDNPKLDKKKLLFWNIPDESKKNKRNVILIIEKIIKKVDSLNEIVRKWK